MTVESERGTSETGVDDESTATPIGHLDNFIDTPAEPFSDADDELALDNSPEVLRYRADSLLDEMMLSAVDVSAADYGGPSVPSDSFDADPGPFDAEERSETESTGAKSFGSNAFGVDSQSAGHSYPGTNGSSDLNGDGHSAGGNGNGPAYSIYGGYDGAQNGLRDDASGYSETGNHASGNGASAHGAAPTSPQSIHTSSDSTYREESQQQNGDGGGAAQATPEWRVKTGGGDATESTAWNDYVSSFRSPSPSPSSGQIQKWQPTPALDGYSSTEPVSNHREDADAGSTSNADTSQEYAQTPAASDEPSRPQDAGESSTFGTGYVSAMAVMPKGPRRSALLPRMSRFDIDSLNREIAELHEEIRTLLPIGHDQAERAQHLLDKAHTIADSDPQRSAEVEYYMQQVRSIVERTRESRRWSNLYRDRLRIYLFAWALLSTMTLAALWASQFQIEAFVSSLLGAAQDAMFMRNFAGALGSIMAGALGSAMGSLINMRKHARSQYGFFDRKYGLRGLTLPIIGSLVGLLIYALFAVVYYFAGINPSLSVIAMATPALLAFIFGFSQESLYGTTS